MIVDTLACIALVLGVAFGLSLPLVGRFRFSPAETVVAGVGLSLIIAWGLAWAVFVSGCPLWAYGVVPLLAAVSLAVRWRAAAGLLADPAARELIAGQLLVTGWCVGLLSFVKSHSGGAWTGDAFEHWERALYFLRGWPHDRLFIDLFELPARPPLANVLAAAFIRLSGADYAHFQLVTTILCCLAFLPVGLLAGRFGGRPAVRVAAVVVMVNPLFVQNATYPWTKLQTVFFILAALYFFLRVRDRGEASGRAAIACALLLGGAVVTHYSAGPYVVAIGIAWLAMGIARRWDGGFARTTVLAAAAGACVLAPWFAWSVSEYGWHETFLSNSTVTMSKVPGNHLLKMALTLRDSVLPPQVRGFSGTLFRQSSPWGALRDQFFIIYQLNLLLAMGLVGWAVTLREAVRAARAAPSGERRFWIPWVAAVIVLSFAAYADHDHYGNAHICLQSLVLLGLAFLSSRWGSLGRGWRAALAIGWAVDLAFGIALQFAVEDFALDRWLNPGMTLGQVSQTYNVVAQENLSEKIIAHQAYFSDILAVRPELVLALMGALLCMALLRASRTAATPAPP